MHIYVSLSHILSLSLSLFLSEGGTVTENGKRERRSGVDIEGEGGREGEGDY